MTVTAEVCVPLLPESNAETSSTSVIWSQMTTGRTNHWTCNIMQQCESKRPEQRESTRVKQVKFEFIAFLRSYHLAFFFEFAWNFPVVLKLYLFTGVASRVWSWKWWLGGIKTKQVLQKQTQATPTIPTTLAFSLFTKCWTMVTFRLTEKKFFIASLGQFVSENVPIMILIDTQT